jgi:SAM-dependent methyltransferase
MGERWATISGEVADLYDRVRPSYPEQVVDDVLDFAALAPGDRALEVGCGTGKATAQFAAHGLDVLCLEPSAPMAAIAARTCPQATIELTTLEDWPVTFGAFALVYSAQAWHWVTPEVGFAKARQALGPGGALALFWNYPQRDDSDVGRGLREVYERLAPGAAGPDPQDWGGAIDRSGAFGPVTTRSYHWSTTYSARCYLDLLRTHSGHRLLVAHDRERLLAEVAAVLDRGGGAYTMPYVTHLYLTRRR